MCDAQDLVVSQKIVAGDFEGEGVSVDQLGKVGCWKSLFSVTLPIPSCLLARCIPLVHSHLKVYDKYM